MSEKFDMSEFERRVRRYQAAQQGEKLAKEEKAAARDGIVEMIGSNGRETLPDGTLVSTSQPQPSKRVDTKALKEKYPELYKGLLVSGSWPSVNVRVTPRKEARA